MGRKAEQMTHTRSQRGFLTFSGVLLILTVAAIIFVTFRLMKPYVANYQLQDSVTTLARTATYNRQSETDIRKEVMQDASDLGIDLDPKQIVVRRDGPSVYIAVDYSVPVDLYVRQMDLQFSINAGNRNITATR